MALDPCSYSNPLDVVITHLDLHLTANFEKLSLQGNVIFSWKNVGGAKKIILDVKCLQVTAVSLHDHNTPLSYEIGDVSPVFGSPMTISLPDNLSSVDCTFKIRIDYSTSPDSSAIQWLTPEKTSGGKYPYLFTQCQAIHCRSFIPIQDCPYAKFTYNASITVPAPLVALMSALRSAEGPVSHGETLTYSFEQPVPIPSYLMALAIGALESRKLSDRCSVWSEKETVDAGAFEFAETETYLQAAEAICGPYTWKVYDILLLPPSFPYGGMENPCLTFVTPTLLAGDRSLAGVVAHEISHSWMGNWVTNKTWQDFWMNEGFCVFVERKIYERVYGKPYAALKALIGVKGLKDCVHMYGVSHNFTCLCPNLVGVDPDDAFSSIPYEKGFNLLCQVQEIVGEENMASFIKAHCNRYAQSVVESREWSVWAVSYFADNFGVKVDLDFETLFTTPGMPKSLNWDQTLSSASTNLATAWLNDNNNHSVDDLKEWKASQIVVFLEQVEEGQLEVFKSSSNISETKALFREKLIKMNELYKLDDIRNAEIRFCWCMLSIRAELEFVYPNVVSFLSTQGRMKFTRPLYRELNKVETGKKIARDTFELVGKSYHSICSKMVAKDLGL